MAKRKGTESPSGMPSMPRKMAFWRKEAPKDTKPTTLTPKEKARAKARAKAAGRPYPNLVDSASVVRDRK